MSTQIPTLNLAGAVVGQQFTLDFTRSTIRGSIQMEATGQVPHLALYNESGAGLAITLPVSGDSFTVPAGGWTDPVPISPDETSYQAKVLYVLANAPVTQLLGDYYYPWEHTTSTRVLGNSPIGLSGVSLPVTQVIQDAQPIGQTIVEATPTAHSQTIQWTTDGLLKLLGASATLQVVPDTTLANQGVLRAGPDVHTASDFLLISLSTGSFTLFDNVTGKNPWISDVTTDKMQIPQGFSNVGGQATAGKYGVDLLTGITRDLAIVNNTKTTIVTFTTPNDGVNHIMKVWAQFWVGAGNTNPSAASVLVAYTDPVFGAIAGAPLMDNQTATIYNAANRAQGNTYASMVFQAEVSPNATVTLSYQNSAAGTISDHASGTIELLA